MRGVATCCLVGVLENLFFCLFFSDSLDRVMECMDDEDTEIGALLLCIKWAPASPNSKIDWSKVDSELFWVVFGALVCLTDVALGMGSLDGSVVRALRTSLFDLNCCSASMYVQPSWVPGTAGTENWCPGSARKCTCWSHYLEEIQCLRQLKASFIWRRNRFSSPSVFFSVSQRSCTALVISLART